MSNQLHWTAGLHHDGSALFVSNPLPRLGERVTVRVRAPAQAPVGRIYLRTAPDGENHLEAMHITERTDTVIWWEADLPIGMPRNHYRFKIITPEGAYHLAASGVSRLERPDWFDFKILADFQAPSWVSDAVFYEIFPDRFHNGNPASDPQPGEWSQGRFSVQMRPWGAPLLDWQQGGNLDFYGGDLDGIARKLGYLEALGVNALYLTPIFTSTSNHRYDVSDFYHIDPHLGGDDGLATLRKALDAKGFRLILDVTLNHCGYKNSWFVDAKADLSSPTAEYFTFHENNPDKYEAWLGVQSLPKLNYRSEKLRQVMWGASDSVLRYWLREPYRIDGWRLDVANMQGRQGAVQLGNKIGRQLRQSIKAERPDAYVFGEHFYDGTPHLQGNELDASMNYQGFTFALWQWLNGRENGTEWRPDTVDTTLLPAEIMAEQWTLYRAAVPWVIARQQFNLLDSHDTVRIAMKVDGNKALIKLAATLQMTYPGVPCIYYGDEIGIEGGADPDNRRCMPWDEGDWDKALLAHYQKVIGLRRTQPALINGGYQQLYADGPVIAYQRQSAEQRLIIIGHRGPDVLGELTIPVWHCGLRDGATLHDHLSDQEFSVADGAVDLRDLAPGASLVLEER